MLVDDLRAKLLLLENFQLYYDKFTVCYICSCEGEEKASIFGVEDKGAGEVIQAHGEALRCKIH